MKRCPACESPLPDAHLANQPCPRCGAEVCERSRTSDVAATIDSRDSASPPIAPTIDSQPDELDSHVAATIDSRPDAADSRVAATIDSHDGRPSPGVLPTIDSTDSSPQPGGAATDHFAVTLESHESSAGPSGSAGRSARTPPGSLRDATKRATHTPYDPTLDSDAIASADEVRVASIWGSSLAGTSPSASLRSSRDSGSRPRTMQTIHERAIGEAGDPRAPGTDYQIVGTLGEGGMGVVYTARQASIDREVAVKMLKPGLMSNERQREKFLSEAVITGELEHPGIVPIYDMGTNRDGALFYSMKKIQGTPWSRAIGKKSLAENLDILLKVADAVAFAHSRDVIHRDLKPENVMLGGFGEVLLMDWGLAVSVAAEPGSPNVARTASMGGTPAYMAPEMAIGPFEKIGKASDIYLLGAILFECVTGKMPHYGKSASACLAAAGRNEIVETSVGGELVEIALKAMATEPADRYATVQDLQRAIREYQSHTESIVLAGRATAELEKARQSDDYRDYSRAMFGFEEAWELWAKNSAAAEGLHEARLAYARSAQRKGDFDLGLSLLAGGTPDQNSLRNELQVAQRERDARLHRLKTARRVVLGLVALVFVAITGGIVLVSIQKAEANRLRIVAEDNEVEANRQAGLARDNAQEANRQAGLARDSAREALRLQGVAESQREQTEYEAYIALVGLAAAKIDENAFDRAVELLEQCPPKLRNWEWGRLMYLCRQGVSQIPVGDRVESVALSADGQTLATGSRDGVARTWNVVSGELLAEHRLSGSNAYVSAVAISPTNPNRVAIGSNDAGGWLRVWNPQSGEAQSLAGHKDAVASVVFSRDGQRLLTASLDNTAAIWDAASGKALTIFRGHDWHVLSAAFSPDEKTIVTASRDGTVRLWNVADGEQWTSKSGEKLAFTGHRGAAHGAAFSPDGRQVASCGYDKRVLLWNPAEMIAFDFQKLLAGNDPPTQRFLEVGDHRAAVRAVAFSFDGRHLLSASHDNSVKIWSLPRANSASLAGESPSLWKSLRGHHGMVSGAAFFPQDDNLVITGSHDGFARVWNVKSYEEQRVVRGKTIDGHDDAVLAAKFSGDGDFILTASRDRTARAWRADDAQEVQSYREGHAFLATRSVFFPSGERLLTAGMDGTLRIWDVETGAQRRVIRGAGYAAVATICGDGSRILGGLAADDAAANRATEETPRAAIWNGETGELLATLARHKSDVTAVAFSADDRFAYTGDANGRGNLWEPATGRHVAKLSWHTARITAASFLAESAHLLLTASMDGTVCVWDISDPAAPQPLESRTLKHGAAVTTMAASADGRSVVTGCDDGKVRWWNGNRASSPRIVPLPAGSQVTSVALTVDAGRALVVDAAGRAVWLVEADPDGESLPAAHRFLDLGALDVPAWSATFAPNGRSVVTIGGDEARQWDLQGQETMQFNPHRTVAAASYSPTGDRVVSAGWDNSARIWDAKTGQTLLKLDNARAGKNGGHAAAINSAAFSHDGAFVLTASDDHVVKLWDTSSGQVVRNFVGHSAGVRSAAFSNDGRRIVSASSDGTARVWDADSAAILLELKRHELPVSSAVFSADGKWIVTGSEDNTAIIWDAAIGEPLRTLKGHTAAVTSVAVLDDRSRVLTGSVDQTAKIWDATNGKEILTLKGHTRGVTSVAFARDQQKALTASRDGTAVLWMAAPWRGTSPNASSREGK